MGPLTAARRGLAVNPSTNHSHAALSRDGYRVPLPSPVPQSPLRPRPRMGGGGRGCPSWCPHISAVLLLTTLHLLSSPHLSCFAEERM